MCIRRISKSIGGSHDSLRRWKSCSIRGKMVVVMNVNTFASFSCIFLRIRFSRSMYQSWGVHLVASLELRYDLILSVKVF